MGADTFCGLHCLSFLVIIVITLRDSIQTGYIFFHLGMIKVTCKGVMIMMTVDKWSTHYPCSSPRDAMMLAETMQREERPTKVFSST